MATPYEELGVRPDAGEAELRAAYRSRARALHPDLNPGRPDLEERLRHLNRAWAVLSDPVARARYDRGDPAVPVDAAVPAPSDDPMGGLHLRPRLGAVLVLGAVALIVVTAYAGDPSRNARPSSIAPAATGSAVGLCLDAQPALDAFVPCTGTLPRVEAQVTAADSCPAATVPHTVRGRTTVVCLRSGAP